MFCLVDIMLQVDIENCGGIEKKDSRCVSLLPAQTSDGVVVVVIQTGISGFFDRNMKYFEKLHWRSVIIACILFETIICCVFFIYPMHLYIYANL